MNLLNLADEYLLSLRYARPTRGHTRDRVELSRRVLSDFLAWLAAHPVYSAALSSEATSLTRFMAADFIRYMKERPLEQRRFFPYDGSEWRVVKVYDAQSPLKSDETSSSRNDESFLAAAPQHMFVDLLWSESSRLTPARIGLALRHDQGSIRLANVATMVRSHALRLSNAIYALATKGQEAARDANI